MTIGGGAGEDRHFRMSNLRSIFPIADRHNNDINRLNVPPMMVAEGLAIAPTANNPRGVLPVAAWTPARTCWQPMRPNMRTAPAKGTRTMSLSTPFPANKFARLPEVASRLDGG